MLTKKILNFQKALQGDNPLLFEYLESNGFFVSDVLTYIDEIKHPFQELMLESFLKRSLLLCSINGEIQPIVNSRQLYINVTEKYFNQYPNSDYFPYRTFSKEDLPKIDGYNYSDADFYLLNNGKYLLTKRGSKQLLGNIRRIIVDLDDEYELTLVPELRDYNNYSPRLERLVRTEKLITKEFVVAFNKTNKNENAIYHLVDLLLNERLNNFKKHLYLKQLL